LPRQNREIVADTGPLIALDSCNQIQLLRELFSRVFVPQEVARELSVGGSTGLPKGLTPSLRKWISVKALTKKPEQLFTAALDDGEAEVIVLALELPCHLVLLDEPIARRVAQTLGLSYTGSLGVLLCAKRKGLIGAIKPSIDLMLGRGVRIKKDLIEAVLLTAGERVRK
jgi:predicted nucleic acid-binding protein